VSWIWERPTHGRTWYRSTTASVKSALVTSTSPGTKKSKVSVGRDAYIWDWYEGLERVGPVLHSMRDWNNRPFPFVTRPSQNEYIAMYGQQSPASVMCMGKQSGECVWAKSQGNVLGGKAPHLNRSA